MKYKTLLNCKRLDIKEDLVEVFGAIPVQSFPAGSHSLVSSYSYRMNSKIPRFFDSGGLKSIDDTSDSNFYV